MPDVEVLPHDAAAERAVLGSCMASKTALTECGPLLVGTDFYSPANEAVWDAIEALHVAGMPVDPITMAARMAQDGTLAGAGGCVYLADLSGSFATSANASWYANIVRESAAKRRVAQAGVRIVQMSGSQGAAADVVLTASAELAAAWRPDPSQAKTLIGDLIDDAINSIEDGVVDGVGWPWRDANRVLNAASAGQFIIVAARPGVGKSVVCVDLARNAALKLGLVTVLHSLEMGATEIIHRILSAEARVPLNHIKKNDLSADEWERIAAAQTKLREAPLHIIDNPSVGIPDLQASIARYRPAMVIVDYAQLMRTNPKVDRRLGLEELTRGIKVLAKVSGIPIVVAAQLNRGAEMRTDKMPQMADLRETGSFEHDADVIVLLHRPDLADPESPRAGEMDLIVAKQRNGPTSTVTVIHQMHYSRLVDAA